MSSLSNISRSTSAICRSRHRSCTLQGTKGGAAMSPTSELVQNQIAGPAGSLHFDDGGTGGLPVVFLHSFSGSTAHWRPQLEHLRSSRRAVALDLRGHGRSQPPAESGDYAVESLAGDVEVVVDALGL